MSWRWIPSERDGRGMKEGWMMWRKEKMGDGDGLEMDSPLPKWRLDLYPSGNEEENGGNHISLYLVICDTESSSKGWEVCVDVNFFVYDHRRHMYAAFGDVDGNGTRFHEKKVVWGLDRLISLESFKDIKNGYLFNDSCVFGAEVFAVPDYTEKDRCLSMIKPPETINTHAWRIPKFSAVSEKVLYSDIFKVGKVKWYSCFIYFLFFFLDAFQ